MEEEPEVTAVEEEIKKGEKDDEGGEIAKKRRHRCEESVSGIKPKKDKEECCRDKKRSRHENKAKTATVFVYEKECTLPKIKAIPRHCLTKEKWIDILATPSRKCPGTCEKKKATRKLRPVSTRMAELARPPQQRLYNTLEMRGGTLPTELVDNLIRTLEAQTSLTPEEAERMFRDKERASKKKKSEKKSRFDLTSCEESKQKIDRSKKAEGVKKESLYDREAVNGQYSMAESFVKSILCWKTEIPREEFEDIARVILKRLATILEYEPIEGEDRKSQQMRFLADLIGSWISGVLLEVAEAQKAELEEECQKKKDEEELEEEDDDDDDDDDDDEDDDENEETDPEDEDKEKKSDEQYFDAKGFKDPKDKPDDDPGTSQGQIGNSLPPESDSGDGTPGEINNPEPDDNMLGEEPESEIGVQDSMGDQEEISKSEAKEEKSSEIKEVEDEERKSISFAEKMIEESGNIVENRLDHESMKNPNFDQLNIEKVQKIELSPLRKRSSIPKRITRRKTGDLPKRRKSFRAMDELENKLTIFGQIFQTIYRAIEDAEECKRDLDPIRQKLHRSLYEKCAGLVREENSEGPLPEKSRRMVDRISEKTANWLTCLFNESGIKLTKDTTPNQLVFDWKNLIDSFVDQHDDPSKFIENPVDWAKLARLQDMNKNFDNLETVFISNR